MLSASERNARLAGTMLLSGGIFLGRLQLVIDIVDGWRDGRSSRMRSV